MKKLRLIWAGMAFILGFTFNLHAQEAPDSIVQMTAQSAGLSLVSAADVPEEGTFWLVMSNGIVPDPAPLFDPSLPIYAITTNGQFLVDDTDGQVALDTGQPVTDALAALAVDVTNLINQIQNPPPMSRSLTMRAMGEDWFTPEFTFSTNGLYLQINAVSNDLAYLTLNNGTDEVYEVLSKTDLTATNWTTEPGVLFPTDSNAMPFTVSEQGRTNLFILAMDWTGITSNGNETPDWWFWYYFQALDLSDGDLDSQGNTLLYDYTNGVAPNGMGRAPTLLSTINVADPVDIKWAGNLYVLSGGTATITEFDTNGSPIRSLSGLGSSPSGFDVDAAGNVYVALAGGNQVWKFNPAAGSFTADTNFGSNGFIGNTNGISGTNDGEFNAPFDVAVSPDGGTISVSDSGNNRVQQFSTSGTFIAAFGSPGGDVGEFNMPEGLTYDSVGNLYVADSGNNRIVLANDSTALGASGTFGAAFGQFNAPANISVNDRGIYVADTGNNRIQCFNPLANGVYSFDLSDLRFAFSTNFNQPFSVAAVDDLLTEKFYVADTGNNRVLFYGFAADDPTPAWNNMTNRLAAGDISGAASYFSSASSNDYQQAFSVIGTNDVISDIGQIGPLTPVYIKNDAAEYYFEQTVDGQLLLFPVEFIKENGLWKISEF